MSRISVLMPAYNSAMYIAEAINSVLNQTFPDFELIIINDGSTDNTHDIISTFNDSRIKYIQQETNSGLAAVRNKLIKLSTSEYIAFLDSDDIADEKRLETQFNYLQSNNEISIVASSVSSLDSQGNKNFTGWKFNFTDKQLRAQLLFYNPIVTSTVMCIKNKLPEVLFRAEFPPCEDYDLWTRMLLNNKGTILPDYLATYRLYNNSVSKRKADDAILNRNKVIVNELSNYFSNQYSPEEAQLHLSLADFSIKNRLDDLQELKQWIGKLIQLNKIHHHFDEQILKQILYERVLKKFLRLQDYNFTVYKTLIEFKKDLEPALTFELWKKELAIFAFAIAKKKLIEV